MNRYSTTCFGVATLLLVAAIGSGLAQPQSQDPEWVTKLKAQWDGAETWTAKMPGDLNIDAADLCNLRLVYKRVINPGTDHATHLDVAHNFDEVAWYGKRAMLSHWYTCGDLNDATTRPQFYLAVVDWETLRINFEFENYGTTTTILNRESAEDNFYSYLPRDADPDISRQEKEVEYFEVAMLGHMFGMMGLEVGDKFRIPVLFAGEKAKQTLTPVLVAERTTYIDVNGTPHDVLRCDRPGNNGWFSHYYVTDKAPYFLGYERKHAGTGEMTAQVKFAGMQKLN